MKTIASGIAILVVLGAGSLTAADPTAQDVARAQQAARENRLLPGHAEFYQKALREAQPFIEPLLQQCALQDCFGAGASNTYVVRVQTDGLLGKVFVLPPNKFTACLAEQLQEKARLSTPPPSDDYWISWSVSGTMAVPEGCREDLTPPTWHTIKWWFFLGDMVFPRIAFRIRAILILAAIMPFALTLTAWRILRPDDRERQLLVSLAIGIGGVLMVAVGALFLGHILKEGRDETRENVLVTLLFAFPFTASLPLAVRGVRRPEVSRGARRPPPAASPLRKALGLLLLITALLPAAAMFWFAVHENAVRVWPAGVRPYKFTIRL